jgi:glutamate-ammonia-ligase adenylyltransferase
MGKHGAGELNYSSDIDLIVLFDEDRLRTGTSEEPMAFATRLTRSLAHILENKTRDGYVFRTDLRLRPHLPATRSRSRPTPPSSTTSATGRTGSGRR